MDKKDKQLLVMLDSNSRSSNSFLAKKLKISRQVVNYRIQRLLKEKIIFGFVPVIDPTKFVNNIWHVYLKLQNLTVNSEESIINYLLERKKVWWITKCQGEWDLIFSIYGDDIFEFDYMLVGFYSKFHHFINQQHVTSLIKVFYFPRKYFGDGKSQRRIYVGKRSRPKIDRKDIQILKLLAQDARIQSTKISRSVNLSAKQVAYRIQELQKKEVIRGYRLHLNLVKLNYDYYKVCFYAQEYTEKSEKSILTWCESNNYAVHYVRKIAPWTFEIEFETPDFKELNKILQEMRNKFGEIIKRTETTLITEEYKGELTSFI